MLPKRPQFPSHDTSIKQFFVGECVSSGRDHIIETSRQKEFYDWWLSSSSTG